MRRAEAVLGPDCRGIQLDFDQKLRRVNHETIARILLALFCGVQGLSTALIDLNRTHATHPRWIGHARFHVVWQTSTVLVLSVLEIALVLTRGPLLEQRFYIAAMLAAVPMLGFFAALTTRSFYSGTLSDPEGIPPSAVRIFGIPFRIDLNLAAEVLGVLSLVAIIAIYHSR